MKAQSKNGKISLEARVGEGRLSQSMSWSEIVALLYDIINTGGGGAVYHYKNIILANIPLIYV